MENMEDEFERLVIETGGRVVRDGFDVVALTETLMRSGYELEPAASIAVSSVGGGPSLAAAIVARFEARLLAEEGNR